MIIETAATNAMKVIGPWLRASTESQSVALFFRPLRLSLIHISEPTRRTPIAYAVFCLKKKFF